MSINRAKLRARLDAGDPSARLISALIQHPRRLLSTILFGNTLAMVTMVVFGTQLAFHWARHLDGWLPIVAIAFMTLAIVIVGEIIPKSIAAAKADAVASLSARPIQLATTLLRPVVDAILTLITPFIRLLGAHEALASPRYTEDELRMLLEIGHEQGVIEEEESDLVSSALAFDDTPVSAILTPRVDMVALSETATLSEVVKVIAEEGYSRIPVYRGSPDQIVGILYARDALLAAARDEGFDVKQRMHPAYFVPETKRLNELLREMQVQEIHMAIVNDEYGGTAGLVTIEDIVEQIVGEIRDEYDEERPLINPLSPGVSVVEAMASIDEVNETLCVNLPIDGYQTIGGLVISHLGRVAKVGDVIELDGARITVKGVKGIRVKQVLIEHAVVPEAEEVRARPEAS